MYHRIMDPYFVALKTLLGALMYEYKQAKTVVTDLQYFVFAKIFHCKVLNSCTVLYNVTYFYFSNQIERKS